MWWCGASWGVVSRSRRARGGGTKDRHTQRTDGQTGRAWPLTEPHARPAGTGKRDARGDGSNILGRPGSIAGMAAERVLLLSRLSHAYQWGPALSVGGIACGAAEARPRALWLLPRRRCGWMRNVLTAVYSNQVLCSPQPHPGRAVRMRDGRAFTRRSLYHHSVGERRQPGCV